MPNAVETNKRAPSPPYYTLVRVLLFCLCCAIILAFSSGLLNGFHLPVADHLSILLATVLTFGLILIFAKWEKLKLSEIGVVPGQSSIPRFLSGFGVGMCMAASQALIVLAYGHFQLIRLPEVSFIDLASPLLLYFLVACREELAFRSYPLRTLNKSIGPLSALTIIAIIFIFEHAAGGMTWRMSIFGSGAGAILFGVSALKTKGLALSLGLHSAWNFGQWTLGFKNKPGMWQAVVEKGYESEVENVGLAAFVIIMLIAITGICFFYRKENLGE